MNIAYICEIAQRTAQTFRERLFPSNGGKCKLRQVKFRSLKMDSLAFSITVVMYVNWVIVYSLISVAFRSG